MKDKNNYPGAEVKGSVVFNMQPSYFLVLELCLGSSITRLTSKTLKKKDIILNMMEVQQTQIVFNNILIIPSKFFLKVIHIGQRQFLSNFFLKILRVSKVRFMRFY